MWLFLVLHLFIGSTLAGSAVIAALAMGHDTGGPILLAAAAGFLLAFPASLVVARKLKELE